MGLYDVFFGTTQSQYAAYAILAAIFTICMTILFSGTDMTIGSRLLMILFVILTLVPSIFLILFEITCMVTGGSKDKNWWCWLYAWIIAVFIIIYCLFVVIISLSSLFTYNTAMEKVSISENNNIMSPENSNQYAIDMMNTNTPQQKENFYVEHFYNSMGINNNNLETFANVDDNEKKEKFKGDGEEYKSKDNSYSGGSIPQSVNDDKSKGKSSNNDKSKDKSLHFTNPTNEKDEKDEKNEKFKDGGGLLLEEDEENFEAFSNYNYARY